MRLAEAMNTYEPALYCIKQKGYKVRLDVDYEKEEIIHWIAEKGEDTVYAFSPLSLLALVCVVEECGENWNKTSPGNLYDSLIENERFR